MALQPPVEVQGRLIIEAKGNPEGAVLNIQFRPRTLALAGGFAPVKDDLSFKVPNAGLDRYDLHVNQLPEGFSRPSAYCQFRTWHSAFRSG